MRGKRPRIVRLGKVERDNPRRRARPREVERRPAQIGADLEHPLPLEMRGDRNDVEHLGVILVPEREKVFTTLTVKENLQFASRQHSGVTVEGVLSYFPTLAVRRGQLAGYLSGGEKQMFAICMALLCRPTLLLIDELSLGLAPMMTKQLMDQLQQVTRELGLTVLLVEQNANAALAISDFGYVMEGGRVVFSGKASDLMRHPDVQEFYLGGVRETETKSYREIKQYRRKRRWWG